MSCHRPERVARDGSGVRLADVLRAGLPALPWRLPAHHWKVLNAILSCRTDKLGGHLYRCQDCGGEHFVPHSCRNRHCPNCQNQAATDWLQRQSASLLPVPYFHVVFTLPHDLNGAIAQNQRALYKLLFDAASSTLLGFGMAKWKAQMGVTAVLHTWSQTLLGHYHLHCIVTGGGLTPDRQRWKGAGRTYLFPVRALSTVFRARFRDGLRALHAGGKLTFHGSLAALARGGEFAALVRSSCSKPWTVYCKKPFAGPQAVLAYLSRYTHRVAIGNRRILGMDAAAGTVTFSYKDYADKARRKRMTLPLAEFTRRFSLHILPERFVKIRHYGLLGNHRRAEKIAAARAHLGTTARSCEPARPEETQPSATPPPLPACPHCGSSALILIERRNRSPTQPPPPDTS